MISAKSIIALGLFQCVHSIFSFAQESQIKIIYEQAFQNLTSLEGKEGTIFKEAVFITENAFAENRLDSNWFNEEIQWYVKLITEFRASNRLQYNFKDSVDISKHAAIFKVLTDTTLIRFEGEVIKHLPLKYDFEDFFGERDWLKMFVSKLLATKEGNCHSFPYLYKILAGEFGIKTSLALAPNHIYIKHRSLKTGMYNTELTSATFPIDAWIMASGYIHLTAIQNGVYMKALNDKESLALCLIDLAEGYKRKTNNSDPDFIIKCCDKALEYFPNYVNALILKAETIKSQYDLLTKANPNLTKEVKEQSERMFSGMQDLYAKVHKLGYRQMPKKMYMDWLLELKTEKEKYLNKNVSSFDK